MEELVLTNPETKPSTTSYKVFRLDMNIDNGTISITVVGTNKELKTFVYSGAQGINFIKLVNTGDFTTVSLHKRILQRLDADGHLTGTVQGAPD